MRKLKIGVAGLVLGLVAVLVIWQEQRAQRLQAEVNSLRAQISAAESLQEDNQRLVKQMKTSEEHADANLAELMHLRRVAAARGVQKESSQTRSASQPPLDRTEIPKQQPYHYTPEQWSRFVETLNFGKKLGLALSTVAEANDGQMPTNLTPAAAWLATNPVALEGGSTNNGINEQHFDLVYKGRLPDLKDPEHTIMAQEKEPVEITAGLWIRFYVFADGHVQRLEATTADGFAARENELWPKQPSP